MGRLLKGQAGSEHVALETDGEQRSGVAPLGRNLLHSYSDLLFMPLYAFLLSYFECIVHVARKFLANPAQKVVFQCLETQSKQMDGRSDQFGLTKCM